MTRIVQVEPRVFNVSDKTNWVFVEVEDSLGRTGWGEASLIGWEPLLLAATRHLAHDWVGQPLAEIPDRLQVSPSSPGGLVVNAVASAMAQATASLLAADQGLCHHEVLGTALRDRVPLYANVTAARVTDPAEERDLLVQQVTGRVRWRESVLAMVDGGVEHFVEFGGKVLGPMVGRIAPDARTVSLVTMDDLEAFAKEHA